MKYTIALGVLLCGVLLVGYAQESGKADTLSFSKIRIVKAPHVEGKAKRIERMSGGVALEFIPEDPNAETLKLRAQEIRLSWPETGGKPTAIAMRGDVDVQGSMGDIKSDKADLDMNTKSLVFEGNVRIDTDEFRNARASRFEYNIETGDLGADDLQADDVPFGEAGSSAAADPSLLTVSDVKDWAGFLSTLRKQSAAEASSPGKQVVSLMDARTREFLGQIAPDSKLDDKVKQGAAKAMNAVLKQSALYDEAAWKNVELSDEAKALVAKGPKSLSEGEMLRLNRLLLEAAYPEYVAEG